ncbi:inositol monophosphatase 1-like [Orbicella faveolata]|uniref:inositol monophosphatase 1-like n=1 Tax=Orbicella faveolata TaxID=48498 RepID=UPI0009E2F21A|nr:inositol monophosphatase 1-like [Orbicella faveolata]
MADDLVQAGGQEIQEYFDAAVNVAKQAGQVVLEAFHKEKAIDTKTCGTDLVTETDKYVEELIIGTLLEKFPTHSFIGEESASAGKKSTLTNNPTWIIDPIDGTTNFIHRYPMVAVCIALAVNKQVEIGVVFNSITNEMYTARRGMGAFCNGKQIHCSGVTDLSNALVITEVGSSREPEIIDVKMKNLRRLLEKPVTVHGIRMQGSAAINLCTLASGGADASYEFGLHVWDFAAAGLIVEEAGGVVLDPSGKPVDLMARRVLAAATNELAQELSQYLDSIDLPRD